jgi:hypothetical protein
MNYNKLCSGFLLVFLSGQTSYSMISSLLHDKSVADAATVTDIADPATSVYVEGVVVGGGGVGPADTAGLG